MFLTEIVTPERRCRSVQTGSGRRKPDRVFILLIFRTSADPRVSVFCRGPQRCWLGKAESPHVVTRGPTPRFSSSAVTSSDRGRKSRTRGHTRRDRGVPVLVRCVAGGETGVLGVSPGQAGGRRIAGRSACLPWERWDWRFSHGFRLRTRLFSARGGVLNIQNFSYFFYIPFVCQSTPQSTMTPPRNVRAPIPLRSLNGYGSDCCQCWPHRFCCGV